MALRPPACLAHFRACAQLTAPPVAALPQTARAKVLSNTIKQKRKEKAGKWEVPLPKVRPVAEDEMFRVLRSGKRKAKSWKRMITKATFVGEGFTRKPPKYERFIRPSGLRFTKAHVTHPDLKATFQLDILGVKKNPNGQMYTGLGVMTKGTIIEVRSGPRPWNTRPHPRESGVRLWKQLRLRTKWRLLLFSRRRFGRDCSLPNCVPNVLLPLLNGYRSGR